MKEDEVSSTAFSVAQGVYYISQKNKLQELVTPEEKTFYKTILTSSQEGLKKWKQLQSPIFRFFVPFLEKLMIPGLTIHYVLRKKTIEQFTNEALKNGAKQLISLGAGFDSLVYRTAVKNPKVRCIEIDHPATQRVKKEAIKGLPEIPSNFYMLDVDFSKESLKEKLSQFEHFDPKLPTVFVIEGVLMYLTEENIKDLFDSLKELCKKGFRLAFTFIRPDGEGKNTHGPLLHIYLKIKSEPLNWKINADDLKAFMAQNDIPLKAVVESEETLKKLSPGATGVSVHDGELIACADYKL